MYWKRNPNGVMEVEVRTWEIVSFLFGAPWSYQGVPGA